MRKVATKRRRPVVQSFNDFIFATGGKPLLKVNDERLLRGPFDILATITDNAVVDQTLVTQSLWDKRVQGMYGASAATPVKGILHLAGFQVYINSANFRGETQALKESLDNGLYINLVRSAKTLQIPMRGHICEAWSQFDFKQAAAATEERALMSGPPLFIERPLRVDLETDTFAAKVDSAINWATSSIPVYIRVYGHLAPKDYRGAQFADSGACSVPNDTDEPTLAVGPIEFAELGLNGVGSPSQLGHIGPLGALF